MLVSGGGSCSKTDDLMRRYLINVEWAEWHFTSYATVFNLLDPLPNPIFS